MRSSVPVRIEGAQRSTLSYLKDREIKHAWFPKVTVSSCRRSSSPIDPTLHGKTRRNAAGAALQDVMIDAMVMNAMLERRRSRLSPRVSRSRHRLAVHGSALGTGLTYRELILGAQVLSRKLESNIGRRRQCRRAASEFGRRRRRFRTPDHRSRARDAELLCRAVNVLAA